MTTKPSDAENGTGPRSWTNWRNQRAGQCCLGTEEMALFSDAWFLGEARDLGPYTILNLVPSIGREGPFEWKPSLMLRAQEYIPQKRLDYRLTDTGRYHGGTEFDEIAALASILLEARVVAGPVDRSFRPEEDPLGTPRRHSHSRLPTLPNSGQRPLIPQLCKEKPVDSLEQLGTFPDLRHDHATALVKSARLYQQALWISDISPETSWLLLVSAVETAADCWNLGVLDPVEQLKLWSPSLAKEVRDVGGNKLEAMVAGHLRGFIGSTGKFRRFCLQFKPDDPPQRPKWGYFDFSCDSYNAAMGKIYNYRSRALHGGTPFPAPMCVPPPMSALDDDENDELTHIAEERSSAIAVYTLDSNWRQEDLPMHLHLFAYIARGLILNWWRSLNPTND